MDYPIQRGRQWVETAKQLESVRLTIKYYQEVEERLKEKLVIISDNKDSFGGTYRFHSYKRKGSIYWKLTNNKGYQ